VGASFTLYILTGYPLSMVHLFSESVSTLWCVCLVSGFCGSTVYIPTALVNFSVLLHAMNVSLSYIRPFIPQIFVGVYTVCTVKIVCYSVF
jgi:hypothetical protein